MSTDLEFAVAQDEIVPTWTLTGGTPAPGYDTSKLTNNNPGDPYKVNSTYLRLVGDCTAPVTVDYAVLYHANFTPGLHNILLQSSATNFSPTETYHFPLPTYHGDGFPVNLALDLRQVSHPARRYWSLCTGNGDGSSDTNGVPVSIGELKLYAQVSAIEGSLVVDLSPSEEEDYPLIDHVTDGDITLVYWRGTKRRYLRGGILQESTAFQTWHRRSIGRYLPSTVLVTTNEGSEATEPWLVRFEQSKLARKFTYGTVASVYDLALEELSRGLRPTPSAI